jgi:glycosyltransferase involved in cell wall biosynthesis
MPTPANPVEISIIVPFRNVGRHFRQMLESLVDQDVSLPAEIVVVDNGSSDGSRAIAERVHGRLPIRIVEAHERANASYARNVGVRAARGDRLLFVDADDAVAPGYVRAIAAALETHDFVTSLVDSVTLNPEWVRAAHGEPWQAVEVSTFFGFMPATGVNVGLRRSLFDTIGGFPEDFAGSQDIVFSWRAQQAGRHIHLVREAVYIYRYRDSLSGLFRQTRNWGTSNVLLYSRFREAGMPGRNIRTTLEEWKGIAKGLLGARNRTQAAPHIVRLGYCVGRAIGTIRYRHVYL